MFGWVSPAMLRLCGPVFSVFLLAGCSGAKSGDVGTASTPSSPSPAPSTAILLQGVPPASATVGSMYSFKPSVQSAATVTFAIAGMPDWANFDARTGGLTGIPSAGDQGMTGFITISAMNGSTTATLTPFTIEVNAAPSSGSGKLGSVQLSWAAPTYNTDGSVITDLAGYHIYYGTSAAEMTNTIEIIGAGSTTFVIEGLAAGNYYFSVQAFNSDGVDSGLSSIASETT